MVRANRSLQRSRVEQLSSHPRCAIATLIDPSLNLVEEALHHGAGTTFSTAGAAAATATPTTVRYASLLSTYFFAFASLWTVSRQWSYRAAAPEETSPISPSAISNTVTLRISQLWRNAITSESAVNERNDQ